MTLWVALARCGVVVRGWWCCGVVTGWWFVGGGGSWMIEMIGALNSTRGRRASVTSSG
jgi:hypothetical protein